MSKRFTWHIAWTSVFCRSAQYIACVPPRYHGSRERRTTGYNKPEACRTGRAYANSWDLCRAPSTSCRGCRAAFGFGGFAGIRLKCRLASNAYGLRTWHTCLAYPSTGINAKVQQCGLVGTFGLR